MSDALIVIVFSFQVEAKFKKVTSSLKKHAKNICLRLLRSA